MASNHLFLTGFEMGHLGLMSAVGSPAISSAQKRTGNYSARFLSTTDGLNLPLPSTYTTLYVGIGFRPSGTDGSATQILGFNNSDNEQMLHVGFAPAFSLTLRSCLITGSPSITELASGSTLVVDQWYYIEVKVVIGESGVVEVRLDGVLDSSWEGDTRGYYLPKEINRIVLGRPPIGPPSVYSCKGYYDDLLVATDGHVGRCGVELLKPTGAGSSTDLTPSAGSNFECVDEVPPDDDTSYVSSSTVDDHDTYVLSDLTQSGSVRAVQAFMRSRLSEAGEGSIAPVLRSGGVDYTGVDSGLDVSYVYNRYLYNVDPATGLAWVTANVDALEFGPKVR